MAWNRISSNTCIRIYYNIMIRVFLPSRKFRYSSVLSDPDEPKTPSLSVKLSTLKG